MWPKRITENNSCYRGRILPCYVRHSGYIDSYHRNDSDLLMKDEHHMSCSHSRGISHKRGDNRDTWDRIRHSVDYNTWDRLHRRSLSWVERDLDNRYTCMYPWIALRWSQLRSVRHDGPVSSWVQTMRRLTSLQGVLERLPLCLGDVAISLPALVSVVPFPIVLAVAFPYHKEVVIEHVSCLWCKLWRKGGVEKRSILLRDSNSE